MLRKLMLYLMVLATAVKFASLAYVFTTDIERLPVAVYVSTGIVVLFGLFLICKNIVKRNFLQLTLRHIWDCHISI